jgi:uncharacterized DUF497 family protein
MASWLVGGRELTITFTITFTIRGRLSRPIMARPMSRRERRLYAERQAAEEQGA